MKQERAKHAKAAAEAHFKPQPPTEAERISTEGREESQARDEKTARLKSQRLARDVADRAGRDVTKPRGSEK